MIVAEQKPLDDLKRMVRGKKKVLAVGCGTCVSVCFSGGSKETGALALALQTAVAADGGTAGRFRASGKRTTDLHQAFLAVEPENEGNGGARRKTYTFL